MIIIIVIVILLVIILVAGLLYYRHRKQQDTNRARFAAVEDIKRNDSSRGQFPFEAHNPLYTSSLTKGSTDNRASHAPNPLYEGGDMPHAPAVYAIPSEVVASVFLSATRI
eukprot:m.205489 g.205489  ORF g.205489 m.205489 type:complete len:111 (-) comp26048_c0_seq4:125-457(-)